MLDAFQRILQGLEIITPASWLTYAFESIFIYAKATETRGPLRRGRLVAPLRASA